jgi:hypothetical protein
MLIQKSSIGEIPEEYKTHQDQSVPILKAENYNIKRPLRTPKSHQVARGLMPTAWSYNTRK